MENKFLKPIVVVAFLIVTTKVFSQFSVTGPTCVVAGVPFQYNVIGTDTSAIEICVQRGLILEHDGLCYTSPFQSYTKLVWDSGIDYGTLSFHSAAGDTVLKVNLTERLTSGNIDATSLFQVTTKDSIPLSIICAEAKGGNCSPSYLYQWQQSINAQNWKDIAGGTSKDLTFTTTLSQTAYFRREVVEEKSNTIDYSDVSIVIVASGVADE